LCYIQGPLHYSQTYLRFYRCHMGLTCLIKPIWLLYLIFDVLYHFSCIDVSFYFLVHYSRFSKWRPSATLDFKIFAIFVKNSNNCLLLRRHAKFGEDRTIRGRVIAHFRFSKWRPSAILNLVGCHIRSPTTCV